MAGVRKLIILKARRLGVSTAIGVYIADEAIWNEGVQASIVDKNQHDAALKLNGIVKVAYNALPEELRKVTREVRTNDSSWEIGVGDLPTSSVFAGVNARGGTNQILHVSEWGVIQADDPKRSEEILTGALPSAEHGVTIIETTWKGGRTGHLWTLVKGAMELPPEERTVNDWHLLFFPWWVDKTYEEDGNPDTIDAETQAYLREKELELGREFNDRQRMWYFRRKRTLGLFIYREFPTDIAECFKSPIEGAIYADLVAKLRAGGGCIRGEVDRNVLTHTAWDLGSPLNTVLWYFQLVAGEIRIVDCDCDLDLTPAERVHHLFAKGYLLGYHYLPHDAMATLKSGQTFAGELNQLGLRNVRVVPVTKDIWIGINHLRGMFNRLSFRLPACDHGLEMLELYHSKRTTATGLAVDEPVHDSTSHFADALRVIAEADMAHQLDYRGTGRMKPVVRTGYRGDKPERPMSVLDTFFPERKPKIRVLR